MKKFAYFLFIILLLTSLYKDLTTGVTINGKAQDEVETMTPDKPKMKEPLNSRFEQKVPVKIKSGDTVLSIIEQLHDGEYLFSIEIMVEDFTSLNPGTDPSSIKVDHVYYFPLYEVEVNNR